MNEWKTNGAISYGTVNKGDAVRSSKSLSAAASESGECSFLLVDKRTHAVSDIYRLIPNKLPIFPTATTHQRFVSFQDVFANHLSRPEHRIRDPSRRP